MRLTKHITVIAFIISILISLHCSSNHGTTMLVINLGLPQAQRALLYEKIMQLFNTPLYASPPSNISTITINITAADFSPISKTYTPPFGIFKIEVPSGIQRTIEVLAYTPSATIRGITIADLEPGEQNVEIDMHIYNTRIIFPDYYNYRLVQMDDMDGGGFAAINNSSIGFAGYFSPYDVDFDDIGRMYIANYGFSTGEDVVIRLDDITDTSYTSIGNGGMNGIKSVAVDRKNNLLYYATGSQLYRCDLNGLNVKNDYIMTGISNIQSIAYADGMVYIACLYASGGRIVKYNPADNGQVVGYTSTTFYDVWDAIVKNGQCIVADNYASTSYAPIIAINTSDLSYVNGYGRGTTGGSPLAGEFWGPHRFVAILNDKFYVIDESSSGDNLVSFSDLDFNNWKRYSNSFVFFSYC